MVPVHQAEHGASVRQSVKKTHDPSFPSLVQHHVPLTNRSGFRAQPPSRPITARPRVPRVDSRVARVGSILGRRRLPKPGEKGGKPWVIDRGHREAGLLSCARWACGSSQEKRQLASGVTGDFSSLEACAGHPTRLPPSAQACPALPCPALPCSVKNRRRGSATQIGLSCSNIPPEVKMKRGLSQAPTKTVAVRWPPLEAPVSEGGRASRCQLNLSPGR